MNLIDRLSEGRTYSRAAVHPTGLDFAARYTPPHPHSFGYEDAYVVDEDLLIGAHVAETRDDFADLEPGLGRIIFIYHLSGKRTIEIGDSRKLSLDFPSLSVVYAREGISRYSHIVKGSTESFVSIGTQPENLAKHGCQQPPRILSDITDGADVLPPVKVLQFPLPDDMRSVARSILNPGVSAKYLRLYLRSKAHELLALTFDALERNCTAAVDRRVEDARILSEAIQFVERNLHRQLSLTEVAREVESSREKISELFQENIGATIQSYAMHVRMTRACGLMATGMALKQIAYEVGYNHTSNFSIAFKKAFGLAPKQARASAIWLQQPQPREHSH